MSFINWGSESPEQLAIRRRLEQDAIYEQAARMAQAKQQAGGGRALPSEFIATLDWLAIAPAGEGTPLGAGYDNFDSWATDLFPTVVGARRVVIRAESANAHIHEELQSSVLTLDLYDAFTSTWITVWSKDFQNTNYPDNSNDFFVDGIDVTFPEISQVTRIRFTSDPGSNQTYHDWDQDSTLFDFYK
jgi:hypothetical protein